MTREQRRPEPDTRRSGPRGELLAAQALQAAGYRIEARNLRTRFGEIDLLVRKGKHWAAVEVKARVDHPAPERFVDGRRLDRLERSLRALAPRLRPRPRSLRIDVVAVRWLAGPTAATAELLHFRGLRTVVGSDHAVGFSSRPLALRPRTPNITSNRSSPPPSPRMPTLAEQFIPRRKLLLMLAETVLFTLVLLIGTSAPPLSTKSFFLFEPSRDLLRGLLTCFTIAIICQAALSYNDLYDWRTAQNRAELGNRLVHSCGYALVMLAVLVLIAPPSLFFFPGIADANGETYKLIILVGIAFGLVYLLRHFFHWFFYKWRFGERVVIVGASEDALHLGRLIQHNPMAGFELLGFIEEPNQPPIERRDDDAPLVGPIDNLLALCQREGISRVVVALRERRGRLPVETLLACRTDGIMIEERESMFERLTGKLAVESMRPSYLIYGRGFTKDPLTMALKRVVDIVAASLGLLLSLPICLLTVLLVKLTSRGPIFFTQVRTGQDGETFHVIKFRTMTVDAEKESGPVWATKNDSRVTPIGRFLRLSRIDEIPQFVNILSGHMSFVGPRPERPVFVDKLTHEIPFYPLRHTVKPGLTGWAQVQHSYGASVDDAREKLRYDLYYIKNMTLLFDLSIIMKTVAVILRGKGAR
ncbi:MAG: YraN family protein [Planctomycetes bacterium]|nr:YraN family protein [Planctomycetota bacterium]